MFAIRLKERERQMLKDAKMTDDSDFSLVIWDGKSKGSYSNILRSLEQNKKLKVYLSSINNFLEERKITKNEIEFIFRESNGYSAKEIVDYFINEGKEYFKNTRQLNKYLLDNKILEKQNKTYTPLVHEEMFIVEKYKGTVSGIKFNNIFIDWLEKRMSAYYREGQQESLFG